MIHLVVHLFAAHGARDGMKAYEEKALRIFRRHGGEIVAAFRPEPLSAVAPGPDEIQVLRIPSREAFERFLRDPDRAALAREREKVVARTEVFMSGEETAYF